MRSTVQRHQSAERPILHQISSLMYPKIQRRQIAKPSSSLLQRTGGGQWRMFFIQVVRGRPGGRLQFSGGGSKMVWLASAFSSIHTRCPKKVRWRDLMMDESGWTVSRCYWLSRGFHVPFHVKTSSLEPISLLHINHRQQCRGPLRCCTTVSSVHGWQQVSGGLQWGRWNCFGAGRGIANLLSNNTFMSTMLAKEAGGVTQSICRKPILFGDKNITCQIWSRSAEKWVLWIRNREKDRQICFFTYVLYKIGQMFFPANPLAWYWKLNLSTKAEMYWQTENYKLWNTK